MILVSSCLLDIFSRYDGVSNANELLLAYCSSGKLIPVCPEQLGGLPTPRQAVEIVGVTGKDVLSGQGKATTATGQDCTDEFVRGAGEVFKLAQRFSVTAAILKERSPSCGSTYIYDGTFSHTIRPGEGVTAALLRKHGIPVFSEQNLTRELIEELIENDTRETNA